MTHKEGSAAGTAALTARLGSLKANMSATRRGVPTERQLYRSYVR